MRRDDSSKPPVILLGGEANALSVARDLGRRGVHVYGIGEPDSFVRFSRYCTWIKTPSRGDLPHRFDAIWSDFLLSDAAAPLHGSVLLSCSDAGLQAIMRHREALAQRFILDDCNPDAQALMLDKLDTYRIARAAGVATPKFWEIADAAQLEGIRDELIFPLLVKPRMSHLFEARFGRKHVIVESREELDAAISGCWAEKIEVLLMEWIPGGDDRLCSYFTYLDRSSKPLLHFTKRIIRRYPSGMGAACYHVTDWIPELIEPANRLFTHVGLRGVANVEFKQDPRDGSYRLIECNARFVASNCLVSRSGVRLAEFVYARLTGTTPPPLTQEGGRQGLRLWDPARDFSAFRERRRLGELSFVQWLRSITHRQTLQFFNWTDPLPAWARLTRPIWRRWLSDSAPAAKKPVAPAEFAQEGAAR